MDTISLKCLLIKKYLHKSILNTSNFVTFHEKVTHLVGFIAQMTQNLTFTP